MKLQMTIRMSGILLNFYQLRKLNDISLSYVADHFFFENLTVKSEIHQSPLSQARSFLKI